MSSVDERIVNMQFNYKEFKKGISESLTALDALKKGLKLDGAAKGLHDVNEATKKFSLKNIKDSITSLDLFKKGLKIEHAGKGFDEADKAASRFSLGGIKQGLSQLSMFRKEAQLPGATTGIENLQRATSRFSMGSMGSQIANISQSFSAMGVVAITAISNIANRAVNAGVNIAKSLTIAPISGGLGEYEKKLTSIQTILANTKASGANLETVSAALEELNRYSDQTIYNFGEMAQNIGTFTAAGVGLETATQSIKGIANLAALSGSDSEQASRAMYQLSQAISEGRVSLESWNSVVNAGMGGTIFQRALAETAVAMGTLKESAVKLNGPMKNVTVNGQSFRNSIMAKPGETSWITKDVLTTALKNFTGDMKEADLVAQGFTASQAQAIMAQAQTAKEAATVVKTGSQLMGTLKEAAESGWAQTWELIIGDFDEAKKLWTGVNNVFGGLIAQSADARNNLLKDWKEMGGRTALLDGIKNAFDALVSVIKPIKDAFRDIFPAKTGKDLYELTVRFRDFAERLKIGEETAKNLRRTFRGVFAIFSIIGSAIKGVASLFGRLFGSMEEGSGGFLNFTGGIGDFLVALDEAIKKGDLLGKFFGSVGDILAIPLKILSNLGRLLGGLFDRFDEDDAQVVTDAFGNMKDSLSPVERLMKRIGKVFSRIGQIFKSIGKVVGDALGGVGKAIGSAFTSENFDKAIKIVQTVLLGGLLMVFKRFSAGLNINIGGGGRGGILDKFKDTLDGLTGALTTMQQNVKANIILKIAIALALLAGSIFLLSTIDGDDMIKSIAGLAAGMAILAAGMVGLSKSIGILGAMKLPFIAASMVAIGLALLIIAAAMKIMASMTWEEMAKGLVGVAGSLAAIAAAMRLMPKNMLAQAAAIGALGLALNAIAVAMKIFASMDWKEIGKGLAVLAGALGVIAATMRVMPKGMLKQAAALLAIAGAINALALAMKIMGSMDMDEIAASMLVLGGSLGIIAGAMRLMPKNMTMQAAALVAVSVALNLIGLALKTMATMSWEDIARGLVALGGALLILAGGLYLMTGSLLGAAALVVAAGALAILTPVLVALGALSWEAILKGLTALAGVFVILGLAGAILTPVVPVILGLALAIALIGAGMVLAGVGALALASAFGIFVAAAVAGIDVLASLIKTVIGAIPDFIKAVGEGIVEFIKVIGNSAKEIADAVVKILAALLDGIIKLAPKMGQAILAVITTILEVVRVAIPRFVRTGLSILVGILKGIRDNIRQVVTVVAEIIVKFINAFADSLPKVIQAGFDFVIKFINGLADAIDKNSGPLGKAGARLGIAIIKGMVKGIAAGIGEVVSAAKKVAQGAIDAAKRKLRINSPSKVFYELGMGMNEGMVGGLDDYGYTVAKSAAAVGGGAIQSLKDSLTGLSSVVSDNIDGTPVIRPVLDLSAVEKAANGMSSMFGGQSVVVASSYSQAANASAGYESNKEAINVQNGSDFAEAFSGGLTFNQYNNSPKALSTAEIYRNTRNQLSVAKEGALTVTR